MAPEGVKSPPQCLGPQSPLGLWVQACSLIWTLQTGLARGEESGPGVQEPCGLCEQSPQAGLSHCQGRG